MADRIEAMVATTAFGMGIDKAAVRWICHDGLPDSPDAYLQEIGRAGRDGDPSTALLLFRERDAGLRRFFAAAALESEDVQTVADALGEARQSHRELLTRTNLPSRRVTRIVSLLERVGAARAGPGGVRAVREGPRRRWPLAWSPTCSTG